MVVLEWGVKIPESVERCVKKVKKQPGVKNPWGICVSQYKKIQRKKKETQI